MHVGCSYKPRLTLHECSPFAVTTASNNTLQLGDGSLSWTQLDGEVSRYEHETNMQCQLCLCSSLCGNLRHAACFNAYDFYA